MRRVNGRVFTVVVLLLLVLPCPAGIVFWMSTALGPSETALAAMRTDDQVTVREESGLLTFGGSGVDSSTALIFYPGAGVDYRSYSPLLRQVAARGYFVIVVPMPLNLAFFDSDAADRVVQDYAGIQHWAIGGHSLGGVAAARYAADHPIIGGLILWAAHPADEALKETNLEVFSIYGSNDGLVSPERILESRALLPADAVFIEITGGNHAQFGSYGPQANDDVATITPEKQWAQVVEATVTFLESLSNQ